MNLKKNDVGSRSVTWGANWVFRSLHRANPDQERGKKEEKERERERLSKLAAHTLREVASFLWNLKMCCVESSVNFRTKE